MEIKSKIDNDGKMVFESMTLTNIKITETEEQIFTTLEEAKTKLVDRIKELEAQLIQATGTYTALVRTFDESSFATIVAEIASSKQEGKTPITRVSLDFTADDESHLMFEKARISVPFITSEAGEPFERMSDIASFLKTAKKSRLAEKLDGFFSNPPSLAELKAVWVSSTREDLEQIFDDVVDKKVLPQAAIDRRERAAKVKETIEPSVKRADRTPIVSVWPDSISGEFKEELLKTVGEMDEMKDEPVPLDLTDQELIDLRVELSTTKNTEEIIDKAQTKDGTWLGQITTGVIGALTVAGVSAIAGIDAQTNINQEASA